MSDKVRPQEHRRLPPEWQEEIKACFTAAAPKVEGFLRRITQGDRQLAAALVQETFKQAVEKWCQLRARTDNEREAWLFEVARDRAIDAFRRAGTERRKLPEVCIRYRPAETDVHREAMVAIAIEHFIKVVNEMPAQRALVASLYWRCQWSNREIAKSLGITPGAVSQHVSKARETLKRELSPYVPFDLPDMEGGESA